MLTQDIARTTQGLTDTLLNFEYEAKLTYDQIVKPRWNQEPWSNRLPDVLHACVMWCFARIDLLAQLWKGERKKRGDQSRWIVDFIEHYMGHSRVTVSMAVHMWRHNMMHTGDPREPCDIQKNISLRWLLHWGETEMGRSGHFVLAGTQTKRIICLTLFHLIEDLKEAQRKYFLELCGSFDLMQKFKEADKRIHEVNLHTF